MSTVSYTHLDVDKRQGRWLLVVTTAKGGDAGQAGKMPKYVTESGYEETEDVRTRVGLNAPVPQRLWLAEVASGKVRELKLDTLSGIQEDPCLLYTSRCV